VTQITAALSSGLVSTACFDFSYKLNGFSLELLTITVEIKCDEPSATTCKHDKRGINVASVRPVQARFPFPCFWQHYLNFDTSSSFLRRILGLLTLPGYQAWGFLIHRLTFKRYVMKAILKPFNRTKYQLTSSTHSNPRGSISKSLRLI
jgi:hypothetical protein